MTAGGGILHDEVPTREDRTARRPGHAVQLWVNLPPALKMTPPRYQSITSDNLVLLTSDDGGALIRLIAGDIAGIDGPGRHPHPDHIRPRDPRCPGAELSVPVEPDFSAMAYVLAGQGSAGRRGPADSRRTSSWCSGPATRSPCAPRTSQEGPTDPLDVLLLGGLRSASRSRTTDRS